MGRTRKSGGVTASRNRIQFTISYLGVRWRPTVELTPNKTNLAAARERLKAMEKAISGGTFDFAHEFPDYKQLPKVLSLKGAVPAKPAPKRPTVAKVCAGYIATLRARKELAFATVESYRKILTDRVEQHVDTEGRTVGEREFASVTFSDLNRITTNRQVKKKTFNNVVSAIRGAWGHGYKDLPGMTDPSRGLEGVRIPKKEKPQPDPFPVDEALALVAQIRRDWGELQGNYDGFRFLGGGGLRPSEQIAVEWTDVDFSKGELAVCKARVMGRPKDETKNYIDRFVEVTPAGMEILRRQRAIYSKMKLAGSIAIEPGTGAPHNRVFFHESGIPFNNLQVPWKRWDSTVQRLKKRTRTPYAARHSSVSWMLMIGKNFLWVAEQHGHSPEVMLKTYARWLRGATTDTIAAINAAFGFASSLPATSAPRAQVLDAVNGGWRSERDSNLPRPSLESASYSDATGDGSPTTTPDSPHLPADLPAGRRRRR